MAGDYRVRKTHHFESWLLHITALGPGANTSSLQVYFLFWKMKIRLM